MDRTEKLVAAGAVLSVAAVFAAALSLGWYQSGLQADVYRRQGVEMTQWEVFCGAQPVERYVIPAQERE